jgi:hypothetical protein
VRPFVPSFCRSDQSSNLVNKDNREKGKTALTKADFARKQRQNLEAYLLQLIRATMFLPQANRLCKFLEISALGLKLSTLGGYQGKQGYLRVMNTGAFCSSPPTVLSGYLPHRRLEKDKARLSPPVLQGEARPQVVHRPRELHRGRQRARSGTPAISFVLIMP